MSLLFSPAAIGKLALANRIVIAPMCEYSAEEGCATDWHMIHLGHLALSGARVAVHRGHRRRAGGPHFAGRPGPVV